MTEPRCLPAPVDGKRVETGPCKFGEDWPGVFVRGDDCLALSMLIRTVLFEGDHYNWLTRNQLDDWARTFLSSCAHPGPPLPCPVCSRSPVDGPRCKLWATCEWVAEYRALLDEDREEYSPDRKGRDERLLRELGPARGKVNRAVLDPDEWDGLPSGSSGQARRDGPSRGASEHTPRTADGSSSSTCPSFIDSPKRGSGWGPYSPGE